MANKTTLPTFTPVPRKMDRSNGWKPEVQRAFIEALAETGSVEAAARRVGRASNGAYLLRRHPQAQEFRKAWEAALDIGMQRIEDVAMERALNGVEVPVYSYGKLVGTRTVYNDRLLMFMLRNRAPRRFAADGAKGMNALDKHRLAQMKKEWRKEWERERHATGKREKGEVLASLTAKIDTMRTRKAALLSPETRRLKEAYEQAARRDADQPFWWDNAPAASNGEDEDEAEWTARAMPSPEMQAWLDREPSRTAPDDGWEIIDPKEDGDGGA